MACFAPGRNGQLNRSTLSYYRAKLYSELKANEKDTLNIAVVWRRARRKIRDPWLHFGEWRV